MDPEYVVASEKLRELRKRLQNILVSPNEPFYGAALEWLADQEVRRRDINTLHSYRYHILSSIGPDAPGAKVGRKTLLALTIYDIEDLLETLAQRGGKSGQGLSYNTLTHVKSTLAQVLDRAERQAKLDRNVVEKAKLPDKELIRKPKPTRALTESQVDAILAKAAETDRLVEQYLRVGSSIGPRPGELLGAIWANVDWDEETLAITVAAKRNLAYTFTNGARTKEQIISNSTLKTAGSVRTIQLPEDAMEALRQRREDQTAEQKKAGESTGWFEHDLIFTNRTGGPIQNRDLSDRINEITKDSDVDLGHWSINEVTRHTFATRLAHARDDKGRSLITPEDLANAMGHKDGNPRTVRKYYIDGTQRPVNTAHLAVMNRKKNGNA
jgi:integrase